MNLERFREKEVRGGTGKRREGKMRRQIGKEDCKRMTGITEIGYII